MIRDLMAGVVWGGVIAALGLGVVSQVAPMPERVSVSAATPDPVAAQPAQPAPAQPEPAQPEPAQPEPAQPEPVQPKAAAPELPEPIVPSQGEPAVAEPAPAFTGQSDTGQSDTGALAAPAQIPKLPTPSPAEPAAAAGTAPPPVQPEIPQPKVVATAPNVPVLPDATPASAAAPVPDAGPPLAAPKPSAQPVASGSEPLPETGPPPPATPEVAEVLLDPAPAAEPTPIAPVLPAEPAFVVPEPDAPTAAPSVITSADPSTLAPDTALNEPIDGVVTGRLPRIGAEPVAENAPRAVPGTKTRLQLFARPFDNQSAKPLFAIILLDTGSADLDRAQLAALPFPVSFVVDPQMPGATAAAAIYRAAGQEVLMLASGIPAGATAGDLAQTFQSHGAMLPEAIAAIDLAVGGFQNDRPLATQVVPVLKDAGLGLLTFDRGLNAADQIARREDLPSATIFRYLDAEGEAAPVIRRYLDRAAFKAAQDGLVVVFGEARPETIAALLEWTVEGRASSVALAPASAVLTAP